MRTQVGVINAVADWPANADVLVAPSALHIDAVKSTIRPEVAVATQDIHTAKVRMRARVPTRLGMEVTK